MDWNLIGITGVVLLVLNLFIYLNTFFFIYDRSIRRIDFVGDIICDWFIVPHYFFASLSLHRVLCAGRLKLIANFWNHST